MKERWIGIGLFLCIAGMLSAQSPYFPTGHAAEGLMLKYSPRVSSEALPLHTAIRPVRRTDAHRLNQLLYEKNALRPPGLRDLWLQNNEWLQYPEADSSYYPRPASEHPVFDRFYRSPAHFLEVYREDFYVQVDPILHLEGGGLEDHTGLILNRRGARITAGIDGKVGVYADIVETQARFAPYVNDRIDETGAIPGQGLFKEYQSDVFDIRNGYDFLNSRAHISFAFTDHINTRIGYGNHFIGYGQRSLLLSDYANNYPYLAINTRIWKFHYKNIFAQLQAASPEDTEPNALLPKKYIAAHYLGFKAGDDLELGLFESVVFSRQNGFEWTYLVPVLFYRTAEQGLGSPDNVVLGFNLGYTPTDRLRLYGQIALDEFVFDEWFTDNEDWWGNKAGVQAGLQYYDVFGIEHWDVQAEWNTVRPYTYTYGDSSSTYVHYNQPLAHPLGANFREILLKTDGWIGQKWKISTYLLHQRFGDDPEGKNFGGNLLKSSDTRVGNFGQELFQGIDTRRWIAGGVLGYRLFPGTFLETTVQYRTTDPVPSGERGTEWQWTLGFRMNIQRNHYWF